MRPATWGAAALAIGIAGADVLRPHPALAGGALLMAAAVAAVSRRRFLPMLLAVAVAAGALRYAYAMTAGRGDLAAWQGQKVGVVGTVVTEPELKKPRGVAYTLRVERVAGAPASGKLYVTQWSEGAPRFGERVVVEGRFKEPARARTPGGFDQAAYLARQGVYLTLDTSQSRGMGPGRLNPVQKAAVAARIRLEGVLKATFPAREAALAAGLLFGTRADLAPDIKESFKQAGVFHLLAVSGGNVAMITLPILALLRRTGLSKRWAAGAAIPVVVFFVFLTGAGPSVTRAGLMAVLVLLGDVLRREKDAVNTLCAAVCLLLLYAPGLLFDLGFQLSVCATLGILLFARPIEQWLSPRMARVLGAKVGPWIASGLSVTFAAQTLVEPISLHNFGTFSAVAPLANLLVLAFIDPIVKLGTVSALIGLVLLPVAALINWVLRWGLVCLVGVVKATAAIPGGFLEVGKLPTFGMLAWYATLVCLAHPFPRRWAVGIAARWREARLPARVTAAACVALVPLTGFTWNVALGDPPDTLRVTFLDVGQGDALLIEAPGGKTMLVDAGAAYPDDPKTGRPGWDAGEAVVLPFLRSRGIRRLDYLVLTHGDQDHAGGGATVLRAVPVGALLVADTKAPEAGHRGALAAAAQRKVRLHEATEGERIDLGSGVQLTVLGPPVPRLVGTRSDDNANCLAFQLRYRQIAMLLTCDMEAESEQYQLSRGINLKADLLKVAHHGSGHSSTAPFLAAVAPRYAVISAGNGNSYGHPHSGTVQRLTEAKAAIFRTDRHGSIVARTDGFTLTVSGTRGGPEEEAYRPLGLVGRRWLKAW